MKGPSVWTPRIAAPLRTEPSSALKMGRSFWYVEGWDVMMVGQIAVQPVYPSRKQAANTERRLRVTSCTWSIVTFGSEKSTP